jgi:hypothetical protein
MTPFEFISNVTLIQGIPPGEKKNTGRLELTGHEIILCKYTSGFYYGLSLRIDKRSHSTVIFVISVYGWIFFYQ